MRPTELRIVDDTDWAANELVQVGGVDGPMRPVIAVRWTGDNLYELRQALGVRGITMVGGQLTVIRPSSDFLAVELGDWVVADPRPGRFHTLPGDWPLLPHPVRPRQWTRRRLFEMARRDRVTRCHLCGRGLIDIRAAPMRYIAFDPTGALPVGWPTVDHVVPRYRGGSNKLANLKTACATCNYEKGHTMPTDYRTDAYLSSDGTYRYTLHRRWGDGPQMLWVMCNPSTADASRDDPTIRRCIAFAKAWGFDGFTVVNLWALRASKPGRLWTHENPHGPENAAILAREVAAHETVVVAWGAWPDAQPVRKAIEVPNVAALERHPDSSGLSCLGRTISGAPRHPLYVKGDVELQPWP